jgi:C1A family cysteine protease
MFKIIAFAAIIAVASGACTEKSATACDADSACTWCKCAALPSQCWTLADAKKLPAGVYACDKSTNEEDEATASFRTFLTTYNKEYKNATEFDYRLSVFKKNLEIVDARNAEGEAEHGITKFSDLTPEEFRSFYLGYVAPSAARVELDLPLGNSSNAASVDWRGKTPAVLTPVKNQAQCGSCWAFSATEQIETDYAMAGNKIISLGVQQIVSCDKTDDGCNGGNTETAYEYVKKAGGLETEANYPYTSGKGKTGRCKDAPAKEVVSIKGYNTVSKTEVSEKKMVTQIANSPISVCVDATKWQTYTKGIIGRTCGKQLDHCVQAVGLNTDGAKPYWIVRNSWASDWGEQGYIYVEEGINACGIAKDATTVNI